MNSSNYKVHESEIGGNGQWDANSSSYQLDPHVDDGGSTLGEATVGTGSSTNYQSGAGFNTTAQPGLTVCVGTSGSSCSDITGSTIDFGDLSTSMATTRTAKFSVKNYTSYGYAVTIIGSAPAHNGNSLNGMGTQSANSTGCSPACASQTGVEQFGLNLRANTSPTTVGADPVPIPSSDFSLSAPATVIPLPYRTANEYRYYAGDIVAAAPASSGETTYTATFVANISDLTPGGRYTGSLDFVVTGTY
jgi:hypothetical protein